MAPSLVRRAFVYAIAAGCLAVTVAPSPVSAATNCSTDYLPDPPSNDNRANGQDFTTTVFTTHGITCWATKEVGEPAHAGQAAAKSVWLDFRTLQGRTARIDIVTAGSDFDTRLAVYRADNGALVAENDDASSANRTSKVSFLRTTPGTTGSVKYKVAIDGYTSASGQTADGSYVVSWSQPLVAFTSTTHLTRAVSRVFLNQEPAASAYATTASAYANGHDKQPGWIADDLSSPGVNAAMPVARLYTAVFKRLPDPDGLAYWLKRRRAGTTLNTLAASMTASNEFAKTYGKLSNSQFVDLVYHNVLDRGPDPSGRAYWVTRLDHGFKRSALMVQFSESNEFVKASSNTTIAAIIWRLGHGTKTDAEIRTMAATFYYGVDYWSLLLEDPGFQSYIAGF